MEEGGDSDLEEEEAFFFPSLNQSGSDLSSINYRGRFDWDLGISTTESHLMK